MNNEQPTTVAEPTDVTLLELRIDGEMINMAGPGFAHDEIIAFLNLTPLPPVLEDQVLRIRFNAVPRD